MVLKTNRSENFEKKFKKTSMNRSLLTLSCRRSLSYRNQSIDLQSKSMGWFLYDRDLRHERVKYLQMVSILDVFLDISQIFKHSLNFLNR